MTISRAFRYFKALLAVLTCVSEGMDVAVFLKLKIYFFLSPQYYFGSMYPLLHVGDPSKYPSENRIGMGNGDEMEVALAPDGKDAARPTDNEDITRPTDNKDTTRPTDNEDAARPTDGEDPADTIDANILKLLAQGFNCDATLNPGQGHSALSDQSQSLRSQQPDPVPPLLLPPPPIPSECSNMDDPSPLVKKAKLADVSW
ncbi:hypothetical protein BJY52DRAFT_1228555 [Lactarius psammicola]|nr:hypothetical protein BJY52DRAFT_1228555 [Lactarius psammicola]